MSKFFQRVTNATPLGLGFIFQSYNYINTIPSGFLKPADINIETMLP
jgi:hypothetical protein